MEHRIATRDEWLAARKLLLAKEKEHTRVSDELNQAAPRVALGQGRKGLRFRGSQPQDYARRTIRGS